MKRSLVMLLGIGVFTFSACNKTEKKEPETTVTETTTKTDTSVPDYDAMYRERATQTATQMAKDLKFDADTAMQRKVSTVYYTRAKRRHEARGKYSTDTTGMYMEMRRIDLETDQEFKTMLPPKQYEVYEARRTTYYGGFEETDTSPRSDSMGSTSAEPSGATIENSAEGASNQKVRTKTEKDGDTKTKIKEGDSKTKIKTDKDGTSKVKH